ncbi:hypothetical protein KYK29_03215 [Shinella daejeonensis]|uniref:hypothetical protein n=1 Tax=Shinella daejeonensis TaxID=659017 RepID=UPI0020C75337|nr:hypothetical protein [Shinella daejeonensis]MCP8893925.1 hypothetical protein [Shinella daejeonensis]
MSTAMGRLITARQNELAAEYGSEKRVPVSLWNPSYIHNFLRANRSDEYYAAIKADDEAFEVNRRKQAKRIHEEMYE